MNIPNIITTVSISTACIAIIQAINGQLYWSIFFGLASFFVDCLDGYAARILHQESVLGRQYDSLSDSLVYVVWPAILTYVNFGLRDSYSVSVLIVFVCAGLFRLARFNSIGMVHTKYGSAYPGMPVVFSHVILLGYVFSGSLQQSRLLLLEAAFIIHSVLMVSRIPFPKPASSYPIAGVAAILLFWYFFGLGFL